MMTLLVGCGQPLQTNTRAASTEPSPPLMVVTVIAPAIAPSAPGSAATTAMPTPATQAPPAHAAPEASALATSPPIATEAVHPSTTAQPGHPTVVIVPEIRPLTNEERWRAQQKDRVVFPEPRVYVARRPTTLYWYDPLSGQSLPVGTLLGPFTAQAAFTFVPANAPALEVPYRINGDFGLTSIAPSVRQRMAEAGYTEFVETYVLLSDAIEQRR